MTVGSLFSGIGGFDLGFERAGFRVVWQVENDVKARSVLAARFPTARLYDDVRTVGEANLEPVDVICGGFPCQDVSVAGKREGLIGARTGLFWEIVRIARELKPRWMVLENVPGLLTSHGGRDFHTVLAALADCGFRQRAYRIFDSQYFGVPQRRRRVFIVVRAGGLDDGPRAVLFEPESRRRDSQASTTARAGVAVCLRCRSARLGINTPGRGGEDDINLIPSLSFALNASHGTQIGQGHNTTYHPLAGPIGGGNDGIGRRSEDDPNLVVGRPLTASCYKRHDEDTDTLIMASVTASSGHHGHSSPRGDGRDNLVYALGSHAGAADGEQTNRSHASGGPVGMGIQENKSNTLRAGRSSNIGGADVGVRRLTPLEAERLQGFPDGFSCLCGNGARGSQFCTCADSPRYRQLGNAVTVPVAEWIARRIAAVER